MYQAIYRTNAENTVEIVAERSSHYISTVARLSSVVLAVVLLSACNRAPSRAEALAVLRRSDPSLDTATVTERVWADGPPWFSCAEVIAKLRSGADHAVVRDQVGNWRALVLAKWVTLRDTSSMTVTDPGWCRATLRDVPARTGQGWRIVTGDSLPTGALRHGWDVTAGKQKLSIERAPRTLGGDSAEVRYVLTVAPNASGLALGAGTDSVHRLAMLRRVDGQWQVARLR